MSEHIHLSLQVFVILTEYTVRHRLCQKSLSRSFTFLPDGKLAPVFGSSPILHDVFVEVFCLLRSQKISWSLELIESESKLSF